MTEIKAIQGITNIYDSSEARDFDRPIDFPIAWEIMYLNDEIGKEFTANFKNAIENISQDKYQLLDIQGDNSDLTQCIECTFADTDSFKKVLNESFKDITFYSENDKKIKPKMAMIDDAKKISRSLEVNSLSI